MVYRVATQLKINNIVYGVADFLMIEFTDKLIHFSCQTFYIGLI